MILLTELQQRLLIREPESGMGFQAVIANHRGMDKRGTVYNAELLMWESEPRALTAASFNKLVECAEREEARNIESIRVVARPTAVAETKRAAYAELQESGPAKDASQQLTAAGARYARFSAFENDHRITSDRGLVPGTYATTKDDADEVGTGSEAVERYALPNPEPAIYRFDIAPARGTVYRQGIVQPAHGRDGGGVEVIFDNGTVANTVSGPTVLPK